MPDDQFAFAFDFSAAPKPAAGPDLRAEIAATWALPLGEKVDVVFRGGQLDAITGVLEIAVVPNFPWNPREPLSLRISGFTFSSREIEHWTRV